MKLKAKKFIRPAIFILVGIILGFVYYKIIGCTNGCPVTSSPYWTVLYAGILGFLISVMTKKQEAK